MLPSAPSARPHPRGVRPQRAHIATHVDLQVGDLESAVAEAVARGATVAGHQPQENVRVLIDPAGHPLCLCRDEGWGTPPPACAEPTQARRASTQRND